MKRLFSITVFLFLVCVNIACAEEITWQSPTTGAAIKGELHQSTTTKSPQAQTLVIYLKNLASPRIGTDSDDAIINDLVAESSFVLELDYAKHEKAKAPFLAADVLKLRQDLTAKQPTLLANYKIDPSHIFILVEGYRLKRDVEFARDGNRVLGIDITYPSKPAKDVPVLMEITCDNQNRMGSASLIFCRDTLLEMAQLEGFAAAMVDHPVPPPYKGLDDPMQPSIERMKDAVKKLREIKSEIHASDKIGAIGFSRGGPFAAILAMQGDVQCALVHGNRYDYNSLIEKDPMYARFEKAWGKFSDNPGNWLKHGAMYYLTEKCSPMYLNTSDKESAEYQSGLATLDAVLTKFNVPHKYTVDHDGRGHRVSMDSARLSEIYAFFNQYLK